MNSLHFRLTVDCDTSTVFDEGRFQQELKMLAARTVEHCSKGPIPLVDVSGCDAINVEDAFRFVADQANYCREKDTHEALCILIPSLMKLTGIRPMTGYEAANFRKTIKAALDSQEPTLKEVVA